jgi:flagellar biosynthetic protein FliO
MRCLAMLLLGSLLAAADAAPVFTDQEWSATQTQQVAHPPAEAPGWGAVISMGGGLVVVVALAVGLAWLAKRMNAKRLLGGRGRTMELIETIQVGPRRQLALVRLGGQWLVVGLGEKELTHIATMPAPAEGAAPSAPPSPFATELASLVPATPEPKP